MDVKKAIESVKISYGNWEREIPCNKEESKEIYAERDEVIELLKRGEKLEAMLQLVEEKRIYPEINSEGKVVFVIETNKGNNKVIFSLRAVFRHLLCHTLKELEQKYFPKEVNHGD